MATPRLTTEQVAQVSGLVFQYITAQGQKYGSRAIPLSAQQKAAMAGFFSSRVLDSTRLLVLERKRVSNPEFYSIRPFDLIVRTIQEGSKLCRRRSTKS